jgi:hypothetical protein
VSGARGRASLAGYGSMLRKAIGVVVGISARRPGAVELDVEIDGEKARAIAYTQLVAEPQIGGRVILNSTAVALKLGSGGFHFVIESLSAQAESLDSEAPGHIMKLRYTPEQHAVLAVEEEDSPRRDVIEAFKTLAGMPVIIGQLHSQIAPATAAVKRLSRPKARVAYIMTDSAALPLGFSRLVAQLKDAGLIDITITCGQAFGGELEAVNVRSALSAARMAAGADVAIVCQGPGNVGTGTKYGFSGIEQGEIVNAVNALGGAAIAIPRISFADARPRHRGLSHHTVTSLSEIALTQALVTLPMMDEMKLFSVQEQIRQTQIIYKHKIRVIDGLPGIRECSEHQITLSTMGRGFNEDPEFFLAASAAGSAAADALKQ